MQLYKVLRGYMPQKSDGMKMEPISLDVITIHLTEFLIIFIASVSDLAWSIITLDNPSWTSFILTKFSNYSLDFSNHIKLM